MHFSLVVGVASRHGMAGIGNGQWDKIADPENVAEYMAVHAFLTGTRLVGAPIMGFHLAGVVPIPWMAWGRSSSWWWAPACR